MFNSKKRAEAKRFYLDHVHETCKTTSVEEIQAEEIKSLRKDIEALNALIEEKDEKYNDLEAVYNFMKDIYESQLNAVVDAQNAQNDAEKQVDRLHDLNRILIAENEKLREGLASISKSCTAISKSCTEYINYDGSEAIYGEDAHCKEVDDVEYSFTPDDAIDLINSLENGSCDDDDDDYDDDDDDYYDFWDCDDPEGAIHDELFERNDDEEECDEEDEDPEEELTQEDCIVKSIGNVVECIGDILNGKSDEEVIEKIDFATLCRALLG